ncbi:LysR family transcriptional regulator [Vitiosangium sp. GDMCC 1.1324]|uniref:LysR family transcriptional regulator n=1 Tax=Vitiosangium sp. (strain GDMCC 1.1324) TaxID=2138576 RepID=UPI000D391C7E|nr:LysR family transcriptional regulator [Vitiosangium sp. GDMCC 1.1324]PTL82399.1 LysR family transcriptional regulator [Vitiosangium sp. GDMCC 1.1324]
MDRFQSMAVFVRVVASGSLSKAGRELGMSPAGVSHHIRALEDWLGSRLLERTTRRLGLTEVGAGFHARCVRILEEVEEARSAAAALQVTPRGRLRVNAPITFGIRHLSPAISDYLVAYPEMAIDITLNDRKVDLIEEGFDVAIRIGTLADSSLVARRLAPSRSVLCAAPSYVKRFGAPSAPADLVHHQCLEYTYRATPGEWRFIGPGGDEESVSVSGRLTASNGELLRVAALRGLGITLAPTFIVGEDLAARRLVPLLPGHVPAEAAIYAVYPQGRHLSAKVRSFVDFLAERFGTPPEWERGVRAKKSRR